MEETATSSPFMIKLPSGTKLYGITRTNYIKDGNTVKPGTPNDGPYGNPLYYYTEVSRSEWKGDGTDKEGAPGIQYAAPGTGDPKFYNLQGIYNFRGDKKWEAVGGVTGAELQQEFAKSNAGKPTQISTVIATGPKAVALAANVPESGLAAKLFNANTATPPPQTQPGSGAATETKISLDDLTLEQIYGDKEATRKWKGEIYKYPTSIDSNKQDYIKFNVVSYVASKPNNKDALLLTKDTTKKEIKATIILPIQPSITDLNSVDWNGLGLNPVDLALYGISSGAVNGSPEQVQSVLSQLGTSITKDPNVQKAITLYLKQKAVGVEGLLSRFSGAIVNPNLELLFQGVQLRPFNFTFRLSPRDDDEAKQVKNIIRAFKEAMTPQVASGGLFLATPYVFDIKYVTPGKENHPSLNRIKTCALQSCSVDYTPDGSYMTFNDNEKTMTSYNLTLQFQELEPITSKDYTDIKNTAEIGY